MLTSGVDIWLNNPLPPFEASGTSGMKAILNGVIQLSTYDGWIPEAADKNIGKIFGYRNEEGMIGNEHDLKIQQDASQLYAALEALAGLYYKMHTKEGTDYSGAWIDMMINCVAASSFFTTHRMLQEYKEKIWRIS